jgi:hypothetical protein
MYVMYNRSYVPLLPRHNQYLLYYLNFFQLTLSYIFILVEIAAKLIIYCIRKISLYPVADVIIYCECNGCSHRLSYVAQT